MSDDGLIHWRRPNGLEEPSDSIEPSNLGNPGQENLSDPIPDSFANSEPVDTSAYTPDVHEPSENPNEDASTEPTQILYSGQVDVPVEPPASPSPMVSWQRPAAAPTDNRPTAEAQYPAKRRVNKMAIVIGVLIVVLAVLVGVIIYLVTSKNGESSAPSQPSASISTSSAKPSASEKPSPSASKTPSATSSPSHDEEAESKAELDKLASEDADDIQLDGRVAVMLASKRAGVEDPLDPPPSGNAKWSWKDAYEQHMHFRNDFSFSSNVKMIMSDRFGQGITDENGNPYYVTIVYSDAFGNRDAALSWCDTNFSNLAEEARRNACVPVTLDPA